MVNTHTNAPAMMIGRRAAEIIRDDNMPALSVLPAQAA